MKTIRLVNLYKVYFETFEFSYQINEWEDDKGKKHFSQGEIGAYPDMIQTPKTHPINLILPNVKNIFEAKARLIEQIVQKEESPYASSTHAPGACAILLLRELAEPKDLPLLINFFEYESMKEALADLIKQG